MPGAAYCHCRLCAVKKDGAKTKVTVSSMGIIKWREEKTRSAILLKVMTSKGTLGFIMRRNS